MFAYVGPGAGLALAGSFLTLLVALLTGVGLLATWPLRRIIRWRRGRGSRRRAAVKRVVVLGLDGLDPRLTEAFLAAGLLPNLARLQSTGCYQRLATTWPPLSPVAWSSFSTGVNPGKHAIFDFVRRNPANYQAEIATVRLGGKRRSWRLGPFWIPRGGMTMHSLQRSQSFWRVLSEHGIFSGILRVPVTFPPERFYGVQLSAASVPDLHGTQGTYLHFYEAAVGEQRAEAATRCSRKNGCWIRVHRQGNSIRAMLPGPPHPFRPDRAEVQLQLTVKRKPSGDCELQIGQTRVPLVIGKFTPWVRLSFRISPGIKIAGVCRFLLRRWESPFSLYCSPLQLDPARPAMSICSPAVFSRFLSSRQGTFATLGLAEDTNALSDGILSEEQFLTLAQEIHQERERMFFEMLRRVKRGLVACVFDGPDRIQHMFWNDAPEQSKVLRNMYQEMDALVGKTLAGLDDQSALVVLSDHGFQSFRRAVDLNAWLHEQGYLHWCQEPTATRPATLQDIDWSCTRAFAFGLSGLYLNQRGREAEGIVEPGRELKALVSELTAALTGLIDTATGEEAILEAVPREAVFSGPYLTEAPDILIGYNAGYRVHWDTALGGSCGEVFTANEHSWRGDHCQHPSVVPGVLFCNRPLRAEHAQIIDLAPTVLDLLGVVPPAYIDGKSLRCDDATSLR